MKEKLEIWGDQGEWEGLTVFSGKCKGRNAKIVAPTGFPDADRWAWRTEFFGAFANADVALVKEGLYLVYLDVQDHYGSPKAMEYFEAFHRFLYDGFGFAKKSAMIGLSRGGLFAYNWVALHPEFVACVYADNPVLDFKSWPGGKGSGPGSPGDWEKLKKIYGFKDDAEATNYKGNPIDQIEKLASAKIPCLHVAGDADETVPFLENTKLFAERYRSLGGPIDVIVKPGALHHPHGLEDPKPIVDFILKYVNV